MFFKNYKKYATTLKKYSDTQLLEGINNSTIMKSSKDSKFLKYYRPSDDVVLSIIRHYPKSLKYFSTYLKEKTLIKIITRNWRLIKYIKKPSEDIQIRSLKININAFIYIKKPCLEAEKIVLSTAYFNGIQYGFFIDHPKERKKLRKDVFEFLVDSKGGFTFAALFVPKIIKKEYVKNILINGDCSNLQREDVSLMVNYLGFKDILKCDFISDSRRLELFLKFGTMELSY